MRSHSGPRGRLLIQVNEMAAPGREGEAEGRPSMSPAMSPASLSICVESNGGKRCCLLMATLQPLAHGPQPAFETTNHAPGPENGVVQPNVDGFIQPRPWPASSSPPPSDGILRLTLNAINKVNYNELFCVRNGADRDRAVSASGRRKNGHLRLLIPFFLLVLIPCLLFSRHSIKKKLCSHMSARVTRLHFRNASALKETWLEATSARR